MTLARAKAEKQYIAWATGRTPYATISRKIRIELRAYKMIPTTLYGSIIACANWVYKIARKEKLMTVPEAVDEAAKRFGLDKALSPELLGAVKDIIIDVVTSV